MLINFFDSKGIVHKESVPPGQTVNQTFYLQILERLRNRVVRVRREIANTWFLQQRQRTKSHIIRCEGIYGST